MTAFFSGAHSPGNQWFSVQTGNGPFVVAQDAVYWYSNIEEMWPSGYTNGDTYGMVRGYGAIYEHLNGEIDRDRAGARDEDLRALPELGGRRAPDRRGERRELGHFAAPRRLVQRVAGPEDPDRHL